MKASTTLAPLALVLGIPAAAAPTDYATNDDAALAALITETLQRNRLVRAASANHDAAVQTIPQATALPNPTVAVTGYANSPETRVGPQIAGIAVTQRIPWLTKLSDQGEVAAKQATIHDQLVYARRADVVFELKSAYYDLAYLDRAIRITTEEEQLLRHYETLARAQYSQGVGLQQAVVKLQAEITRVLSRRHEFRQRRVAVEAAVNALRDRPIRTALPEVLPGERPASPIDDDALNAAARDGSPEIRIAALEVERDEVGNRLAKRRYRPDFVLGAGWGVVRERRDGPGRLNPPPNNGRDTLSVAFGVDIPIYRGKLDAGRREADARLTAAKEAYQATLNRVGAAVRAIGARLTTIDERIALIERALLPQAEQALRSTEEAYATGTIGVLDLLDSEEVLLDVRLGLAQLETDYMKALAEMERAIGSAFPPRREP